MINLADKRRYTNGECWALAYAIHAHTGWPIMAIGEEDQDPLGFIGWVHVVNRRPDGLLIDANGKHEIGLLLDEYGDWTDDGSAELYEIPVERFHAMLHDDPTTIGDDTRAFAVLLTATLALPKEKLQ